MIRRGDLVRAKWEDSAAYSGYWLFFQKTRKPLRIETVGWVVKVTNAHVTIAASKTSDGDFGGALTIPRIAIHTLEKLNG